MTTAALVDVLLAEQQTIPALTAVEAFDRWLGTTEQLADYSALLPSAPPGPGQQYAFGVELDACTGCKACVVACRSLNGLDADESWRTVGLLHTVAEAAAETAHAVQQTVTTGCHHCVEPACLSGCPVNAYEKEPATGIVIHLDDQCIGCSYCTLTCPYEVPRYNGSRGIVRKCDMCTGRLSAGEAPACVQACPNGAIRIDVIDVTAARAAAAVPLVPGAPESTVTIPSTVYRSRRSMSGAIAGDHQSVRRAHAHMPLAIMLVLTQLAVGVVVADLAARAAGLSTGGDRVHALLAGGAGLVALAASTFHLGRPWRAYRAVIGIRHSWLSREVVAFGAFAGAAAANAAITVAGIGISLTATTRATVVAVAGVAGLFASMQVYAVTGREWWRLRWTGPRFGLTAAMCGTAVLLATAVARGRDGAGFYALLLSATMAAKLVMDASVLRHRRAPGTELWGTSALLLGELRPIVTWRVGLALAGGAALPGLAVILAAATAGSAVALLLASGAVVVLAAGELLERWLFFVAVTPRRMPGGLP